MEKDDIIETVETPIPAPEAPEPIPNSEGLVTMEYENKEGEKEVAEVPIEEANTTREFQMKLLGHNNNSGMYYRNSGLSQYQGERRFAVNTYSTATYKNPTNVSLFREVPISEEGGEKLIPIPEGYELREIDINRPLNTMENTMEKIPEDNINETETIN